MRERNRVDAQTRISGYDRSPSGFSLVELLVVIGIIAVLIGILLPALTKARQQAARTACSAQMRDICNAIANYAAENKGWLPEYEGYSKKLINGQPGFPPSVPATVSYTDGGQYYRWGLFEPGRLNLDVMPPVVIDAGLGRLFVRRYITNPKILVCPALEAKINLNNSDRGGYFFNPHPATVSGVPAGSPLAGIRTTRFKKLADYRKLHDGVKRAILVDFIYDASVLVHSDHRKQIVKLNLGYSDGSIKMVDSAPGNRGPWGRAEGTSWFHFRASDTIGYMERMADGKIAFNSSGGPDPAFGQQAPNNDSRYDPHDPPVSH
jgi:prepilin-type N-terminal cleavage/methylation domain-containing protein